MKVTPVAALIVAALCQVIAGCEDKEPTSSMPRLSRWQGGTPSAIDMAMQGAAATSAAPAAGVSTVPTGAQTSGPSPSVGSTSGAAIAPPTRGVAASGIAASGGATSGTTTTSGVAAGNIATSGTTAAGAAASNTATGGTTTAGSAAGSTATSGAPGVTVSWQAPQHNEDGTPLIDLAGFRIRHGAKYGSYTSQINVDNPGATSHRLALAPGLHYVVVSAFDNEGLESPYSRPQRIQVR
jgi:hypothetical protein